MVLPAAHFLERSDMVTPAGGDYLLYSARALPPRSGLPTDYPGPGPAGGNDGLRPGIHQRPEFPEWLDVLMEDSEVGDPAEFKRTGLYHRPGPPRVGLAEFVSDPPGPTPWTPPPAGSS